jgi:hypothetical protein
MSLYSHAGVSRKNGEFKVRFCNDALRVKVLAKNGHKDIDIIELREPMTKEAAVAYLMSIDFANGNKEVQAALEAAADKRGVTVVKANPVAKAKTVAGKPQAKAKTATGQATVKAAVQTEAEAIAKAEAAVGSALM